MAGRRWPWVLAAVAALAGVTAAGLAVRRAADARAAHALEAALTRPPAEGRFDPASLAGLPEPARRYLTAAIAPGTPPARSVGLTMRGRFRVGTAWLPMEARERLAADGLVWDATLARDGSTIRAWDTLGPDGGATRVWLLGLVPLARGAGADVTRAAAGRLAAELIWLPSALLPGAGQTDVRWEAVDADTARADLTVAGIPLSLHLKLDPHGHPTALWLSRWGDPDGDGRFAAASFGANLGEPRDFGGYTLPTRITAGWDFGTDAYAPFFDAEITAAGFGP